MKINIKEASLEWSRSVPQRKLSRATTPCQLQTQWEERTLDLALGYSLLPLQGGGRCGSFPWQQPSQWEIVTTRQVKSHYTSSSQFTPVDSWFITAFPRGPWWLSPIKIRLLISAEVMMLGSWDQAPPPGQAPQSAGSLLEILSLRLSLNSFSLSSLSLK